MNDIDSKPAKVYAAINAVHAYMSRIGIAKDKRNQQQGYNFRGIDDVYNALAVPLAEHKLCVLPRVIDRSERDRTTAKGTTLVCVSVKMEFDFVCSEDGSKHTVSAYGEGMDSGDKATSKAMSSAQKQAILQTFTIPTGMLPDPDADSPDAGGPAPALLALREAAMNGTNSLREAFEKYKSSPGFDELWERNKTALRTAASAADQEQQ